MDKKTQVVRVPDELMYRISKFRIDYAQKEKTILPNTEAMRKFAENSITPYDNVGDAAKKLGKYKL